MAWRSARRVRRGRESRGNPPAAPPGRSANRRFRGPRRHRSSDACPCASARDCDAPTCRTNLTRPESSRNCPSAVSTPPLEPRKRTAGSLAWPMLRRSTEPHAGVARCRTARLRRVGTVDARSRADGVDPQQGRFAERLAGNRPLAAFRRHDHLDLRRARRSTGTARNRCTARSRRSRSGTAARRRRRWLSP